jgi:hypothetical protein
MFTSKHQQPTNSPANMGWLYLIASDRTKT